MNKRDLITGILEESRAQLRREFDNLYDKPQPPGRRLAWLIQTMAEGRPPTHSEQLEVVRAARKARWVL